MFRARILGAALSGLEARVLTEEQAKRLDTVATRYAAALCNGIAIYRRLNTDDEEEARWKVTTVCAEAVWKRIKVAPPSVELRIRRLRHFQALARRPQRHVQELAAVCGKVALENAEIQTFAWAPTCAPQVAPQTHGPCSSSTICFSWESFGEVLISWRPWGTIT